MCMPRIRGHRGANSLYIIADVISLRKVSGTRRFRRTLAFVCVDAGKQRCPYAMRVTVRVLDVLARPAVGILLRKSEVNHIHSITG